jgi:peptidase M50-like protein
VATDLSTLLAGPIIVVGAALGTFVHELGHTAAGRIARVPIERVRIGREGKKVTFTLWGTSFTVHSVPLGGQTVGRPTSWIKNVVFLLGGPLASLVMGGALVLGASSYTGPVAGIGYVNVLTGVVSLVPYKPRRPNGFTSSDGWKLAGLLIGTPKRRAQRRAAWICNQAIIARSKGDTSTATLILRRSGQSRNAPPLATFLYALHLMRSDDANDSAEGRALAESAISGGVSQLPPQMVADFKLGLAADDMTRGNVDTALWSLLQSRSEWPQLYAPRDSLLSWLLLTRAEREHRSDGLALAHVLLDDRKASKRLPARLLANIENGVAYELVRYGPVADPAVLAEADARVSHACELTSDDPDCRDTLALVRLRQGKLDVADVVSASVVDKPGTDEVRAIRATTRALVLVHLDQFSEARKLADEAAASGGNNPLLAEVRAALLQRAP